MRATFRVVETDTEEVEKRSPTYRSFLAIAEPQVNMDIPEGSAEEEADNARYERELAAMPQDFAIRNLRQIEWAVGAVEIVTDEKIPVGTLVSLELTIVPEPI